MNFPTLVPVFGIPGPTLSAFGATGMQYHLLSSVTPDLILKYVAI